MLIDVGNGLSIQSEQIISIQSMDDLNCIVECGSKTYTVSMPRDLLVSMIERDGDKNPMSNVEKLLHNIYAGQVTHRP